MCYFFHTYYIIMHKLCALMWILVYNFSRFQFFPSNNFVYVQIYERFGLWSKFPPKKSRQEKFNLLENGKQCTHCPLIGDFHTANHSYPITPVLNAQKMQIDFAIIHFFAPRATSDYSDSCCFFNRSGCVPTFFL